MTYQELHAQHQAEVNAFPFGWAFNQKQFAEAMEKLGLAPTDTDKIYSIGGGGFIRKTDSDKLDEMLARHTREMRDAMAQPGFALEMFDYELSNHEFCVTGDVGSTLDALGLTRDEVNADPVLLEALRAAIKLQAGRE